MNSLSDLIMSLENSQHKIITSYEDIDLLAVQMTREDLNTVLEGLKLLKSARA